MRLVAGAESGAYKKYVSIYATSQTPKEPCCPSTQNCYNKSYFEAGRRLRNRSIPSVCEDFENKPDAKRALLERFLEFRSEVEAYILKVLLRQGKCITCVGEEYIATVLVYGHI